MSCLRSSCTTSSLILGSSNQLKKLIKRVVIASAAVLFTLPGVAHDQQSAGQDSNSQPTQTQADVKPTVTIQAGTRIALVLTQPIQSRYVRRGDDIFAQVLSPVDSGKEVVIPAGTFVQGTIGKLARKSTRGELRLESLSITFPDGYVTPIAGPITLHSDEGYAIKDPGNRRMVGAFALPIAGAGIGALIGHSVGSSQSTMTTTLPPGCTGPPPYCLTSSTTVPGSSGKDTAIGAGAGAAIGMVASLALLFSSHHFYLVAGAPIQMTLLQPVTLQEEEVAKAVRESQQHPVPVQSIAPLPVYLPPYPDTDLGIPPAPAPGVPPTIIPGTPPGTP